MRNDLIEKITGGWVLGALGVLCVIGIAIFIGSLFVPAKTPNVEEAAIVAIVEPVQVEVPQPVVVREPAPEVKRKPPVPTSSRYPDIFQAARSGSVDDIRYFLAQGIDINEVPEPQEITDTNGRKVFRYRSPVFMNAVENNSNDALEVVKFLVEHGADIHWKNQMGMSSVFLAAMGRTSKSTDVLKYLIEKGVDVNIKTNQGQTALDIATTDEKREILRAAGGKLAAELE